MLRPLLSLLALPYARAFAGPPSRPQQASSDIASKQDSSTHQDGYDGISICDTYTPTILDANTPENQHLLMRLFVNTALAGNYVRWELCE
jgi:hypothetical protein